MKSITYREALDEALCFGWIDGVRKSINLTTYKQRFTPRKAKSYWSAVNIRRVGELAKLGRIAPSGRKAFEQRTSDSGRYSFESRLTQLPLAYERQFKATPGACVRHEVADRGRSDQLIAPLNTVNYYESVLKSVGAAKSANSLRLFMFPGMRTAGAEKGPIDSIQPGRWPDGWNTAKYPIR